ncbi:MAG: PqqD family protein [Bradymonadia bacterium]
MTTMPQHNAVPIPSKTSVSRVMAGSAILLDASDDSIHRLNGVGTFVWNLITDKKNTVREIIELVVKEFAIDQQTARKDVEDFLLELQTRRFIDFQ